jgi:hypothetical protein
MPSHRVQVCLFALMLASVLHAHNAGSGQLTASWDDSSEDEADFVLERRLLDEPTFDPASDLPAGITHSIAVLKAGNGAGTVVSAPAGIVCGIDCDEAYGSGTLVTLTAAAAPGSRFEGWAGGCSGTSVCMISGNTEVLVTATFTVVSPGRAKNGSKN